LADLQAHGFVQRRHGLGTYVRDQVPTALPAVGLGLLASLRQTARETQVRVLGVRSEVPPAQVRALLQLADSEPAVHALRLRSAGDTPLMLTDAWVPEQLGRKVTEAALRRKALYLILLDQGVQFGRVVQEISAEAADPYRASLLQTPVSAPLIRLTRLLHDRHDRPVQHLTAYLSPERSRVLMDISSEKIDTLSAGHIAHDPKYVAPRGGQKTSNRQVG
jgi:GntR family transcriptional regulator